MSYSSHDLLGFDYVEHFVGNAKHSARYHSHLLGMPIVGYLGPETGVRDRVSYLLKGSSHLRFVFTSALHAESPIFQFTNQHGDGVKRFSFLVRDVAQAYEHATRQGAKGVTPPCTLSDTHGTMDYAAIAIYGDTELIFLNRQHYHGELPGFHPYEGSSWQKETCGLTAIDHIVGNVPQGEMDHWATFFEEKLDMETFVHFDEGDISTQFSALLSKVVRSKNNAVKLPINEPAAGLKKSQIEEYLEVNDGSGVQHIAILTNDMVHSIEAMTRCGAEFIGTPDTYYEVIADRSKGIDEAMNDLQRNNILLDRDEKGYLLQLFTQPINDRPTLFYEIIQRKGCEGFGQNNFQALFESIEREQAKRGNL
jgi:4-hydroxyphenylpyruvate dioxygenase